MTRVVLLVVVAALAAAASPAGSAGKPRCADPPGWQRLADRIGAAVYCPSWMPDPLDGRMGSQWNKIDSVSRDRSYLIGFVWQEVGSGELHVNLRGYPGRTAIPTCRVAPEGRQKARSVPCFADPRGGKRVLGITAKMYTVNQDADQWHVLYAWRHKGSLYTLSQHVAAPLTYSMVVRDLDRMLRGLVLVEPRA